MKLGKRLSYSVEGQAVHFVFEKGCARVEIIAPEIIRVFCGLEDEGNHSWAVKACKKETPFSVDETQEAVCIRTERLTVRVSDDFYVDFYDPEGNEICMDYRGERRPLVRMSAEQAKLLAAEGHAVSPDDPYAVRPIEVVKRLEKDVHFYGLGDKTGFLDKRHYDYVTWNTDNPKPQVDSFRAMYKAIPFFIAVSDRSVYGIFFDNTYQGSFNMGQESEDYYYFNAKAGNLDYYFFVGQTVGDIVQSYTWLTGRFPLPQKWTLGYHQSRWGYVTQTDIAQVAEKMRQYDIPCDVLHFDIDYMNGYRVFTWDEKKYPDGPKVCLGKLAEMGFKPVVIIDPGVKKDEGYPVYDEGMAKQYFAQTPDGETYVNTVWPGEAVFPDFGKPETRGWWAGLQQILINWGVRGVWNDMNEPASFTGPIPDDVVMTEETKPSTHGKLHNVYGHLMSEATYEGLVKADGRRPFVITRACYAGSQRYTTTWTGDNHSIWAHLQMAIPQLCNLGLSGMPFAGSDVGGFGSNTTPELLCRWVQVGCFSPLFRNHASQGTRLQEPWQFGQEVLEIYRKYVKLRYSLIPYFYDLCHEEEQTGAPIMRPLVFHFPHDPVAQQCNDEFMVGDRLLVAPVVTQGSRMRMVYLPGGEWYDYWTKEKLSGARWLIREAPLDVCPMYVRAGSALPMMPEMSYVGQKEDDTLLLDIYPGEGVWTHYQDNGEDFAYRDGQYNQYAITVHKDGTWQCETIYGGYDKPYKTICERGV